MTTETWNYIDPIDEIYAIRRKISSQNGNDVHLIAATAARLTDSIRKSGRIVISSLEELTNHYVEQV